MEVSDEGDIDFPVKGSIYLHEDGIDAVACQPDFNDLGGVRDTFEGAFDGLKSFMREVEIKIKLFEDGKIEILEVNGESVTSVPEKY